MNLALESVPERTSAHDHGRCRESEPPEQEQPEAPLDEYDLDQLLDERPGGDARMTTPMELRSQRGQLQSRYDAIFAELAPQGAGGWRRSHEMARLRPSGMVGRAARLPCEE